MVCKNRGIYGLLGALWILNTMHPRNNTYSYLVRHYGPTHRLGNTIDREQEYSISECALSESTEVPQRNDENTLKINNRR